MKSLKEQPGKYSYAGVEHEVETVTAGIRMVLQFDVLIHPNKTGKAEEKEKKDRFSSDLKTILRY